MGRSIIDMDSQLPLIGTVVQVVGSDPLIGTTTDANGEFRLEKVEAGRITIQLSYMGYET